MSSTTHTHSSPHAHGGQTVPRIMLCVLAAMLPGVAMQVWVDGIGVIAQITLAVLTALACEAAMLHWRGVAVRPFLSDGTAVVAAMLLAVAMPADAQWWLVVVGCAFAIVVGKHAFGGVGCNLFNPAMAGYALLLVSFPHAMKAGAAPTGLFDASAVDAVSGATALETVRSGLQSMSMFSEIAGAHAIGPFAESGAGWVNAGYLVGGLALLALGVIRWQIPFGFLAGLTLVATLLHAGEPQRHAGPLFHLFSGATMIGAFFIATDPVSSPVSARGRLLFGLGAGALVMVIRRFGLYPDGVAFAVLMMNALAPLIDRLTRPRVLGEPQ